MQSSYDAFISYRRAEASALARWIRNRLQRYRLPAEVLDTLPREKQELHQRRPRIYLDRIYEKPSGDFLQEKVFPALDASQRLIVISTPSAFDTIRDANGGEAPNWLVQEIDRFLGPKTGRWDRPLDIILGPMAPEDRFPGRLSENQRWDWIDLRAFNWWRSWGLSETLDAGFTKLAAGIYDVPQAALPMMRREERRRRRRFVTAAAAGLLFVMAIISVLGIGWWNARKATQIADAERRFNVALRLVDSGAIPSAVDAFARLSDDGLQRAGEAKRLLISWAPRLATASGQVAKLPDNLVFRWRGRNYVKTGGKVAGSYDGPPAQEWTITSKGTRFVTFDADRVIRIRELSALDKPLLEVGPLEATPGSISELFDGQLLVFESQILGLHSDEDEDDAQWVLGQFFALLAPDTARYAIGQRSDDEPGLDIDCSSIKLEGVVQLSGPEHSIPDAPALGAITVRPTSPGTLDWRFEETEVGLAAPADRRRASLPTACQPRVLVPRPAHPMTSKIAELAFPALVDEKLLWKKLGPAPELAKASVCVIDENGNERIEGDCYSSSSAVSVDPARAEDLVRLMRDPLIPEVLSLSGLVERLVVATVTGNQSVRTAYCEVRERRSLRRCLMIDQTARTTTTFLDGNEFAAMNSLEAFSQSFQLVDLRNLRTISLKPSPGENLVGVTISQDGTRLAALTRVGEVWLYEIDRNNASGQIARRYDFRRSTELISAPASATHRANEPEAGVAFSSASFIDNGRLMLSGAKGGSVLAQIPSGAVIWTRPPLALLGGEQKIASDSSSDVAVVYDQSSAQLVSLDSGALLSRVVDFASIDLDSKEADETVGISVHVSPGGSIKITYNGHVFGASDLWSGVPPERQRVEQLSGVSVGGKAEPLEIFLAP
jgi:hypothetical protein